jgi:hypothetical protein
MNMECPICNKDAPPKVFTIVDHETGVRFQMDVDLSPGTPSIHIHTLGDGDPGVMDVGMSNVSMMIYMLSQFPPYSNLEWKIKSKKDSA